MTEIKPIDLNEEPMKVKQDDVVCNHCDFSGSADECKASMSCYHDMSCPKCGTTNLDTSGINKKWAKEGREYGFGDGNTLKM